MTNTQPQAALLRLLQRIESAIDWHLGRSAFTQNERLKGLAHSQQVRSNMIAAHDELRAEIAKLQAATTASEGQLLRELQRAYRCIQGMHNALTRGVPFAAEAYHAPTIAAAKRFVFEGAMDGADYFEGKHVSVLHDALRLPQVKGNDAP